MKKIITGIIGVLAIILAIGGIMITRKKNAAISIIVGADGPTSVFFAGKLGSSFWIIMIGIIVFVIAFLVKLIKK